MVKRNGALARFASWLSFAVGTTAAFTFALCAVLFWALTGPLFHFSDTWQLVINTSTTIITFLMVFLIQRAQNKEALAVQLKLNELVASIQQANNRLISVEDLSEEELEVLHAHYRRLAEMAKNAAALKESHSIEQARLRHERKRKARNEAAKHE